MISACTDEAGGQSLQEKGDTSTIPSLLVGLWAYSHMEGSKNKDTKTRPGGKFPRMGSPVGRL